MNLDQAVLEGPVVEDIDAQIEKVLAMMSTQELQRLQAKLQQRYQLEYSETDAHPFNIKTIIKGREIRFSRGVSPASRAFMILHSLGHYIFICAAKRKNIKRYDYIYDLRGVQTALHYYETAGQGSGLDQPPPMTAQKRKDRVSFEVGANRFAADLLADIGFSQAEALISVIRWATSTIFSTCRAAARPPSCPATTTICAATFAPACPLIRTTLTMTASMIRTPTASTA
ncbi:hypothetical protein JOS77_21795 [Chromobacterium haemolyticum]|nr:hypothetical protein JOS77_21795 [Chromobacterium haemolyticum]